MALQNVSVLSCIIHKQNEQFGRSTYLRTNYLHVQLIYKNPFYYFAGTTTIYTPTRVTKINSDNHTNRSVNESTTLQGIMQRNDVIMNESFYNLIHKNWLLITILLLLLSCIALSLTYCQPTLIRIQGIFLRMASTYFS